MTRTEELKPGIATIFAGRNMGGDENYGVYSGEVEDEDIFALEPEYWPAYEDGFIDYALYVTDTVVLEPGDYTVSFTSSDSGDYFFDLIEGHVTDPRILRAHAIQDSEDWWSYEGKITDPNLGVDDFEYSPNLDETIFLKVL